MAETFDTLSLMLQAGEIAVLQNAPLQDREPDLDLVHPGSARSGLFPRRWARCAHRIAIRSPLRDVQRARHAAGLPARPSELPARRSEHGRLPARLPTRRCIAARPTTNVDHIFDHESIPTPNRSKWSGFHSSARAAAAHFIPGAERLHSRRPSPKTRSTDKPTH